MDVATQQSAHYQTLSNITVPRRLCQETLVMDVAETSGGRLEFQVIQVAPWFVGRGGGPLLGATDGGGLEQAQQQQWGAAATKTCICGT